MTSAGAQGVRKEGSVTTKKENWLIAAKGGKPEWVPSFTEDANVFMPPIWGVDPETGTDFCNVKWVTDDTGEMPDPNWQAMEDVADWRDLIKFPDLSKLDWEQLAADFHGEGYDPDKVDIAMANTAGIFLIPINMMGWVDGLCAIYEDPDELDALTSALTDFLVELIGYFGKHVKPDIIFSGDDIASGDGPFFSREMFQKHYKPYFKKIADAIHEQGALAEFHCCGNNGYLIEEILDMGYDICQLPVPNDSLRADKERFGNRLVITGGWERHGDAGLPGASEEVVRASVRKAIDDFGRDGALIFWDGGIIGSSEDSKQKMAWLMDELHEYGSKVYQQ